jgi:hypothetical protein
LVVCDFGLSRFSTATNLMSLQKCRGTLACNNNNTYIYDNNNNNSSRDLSFIIDTAPEMMQAIPFQPSADV